MDNTLISVILPVYNGSKFLNASIDSILEQTHANIQLIIINDGSTDDSESIILGYKDKRIIYIKNYSNLGLPATLNIGIDASIGEYIARQDQDDISESHRLESQLKELKVKNLDLLGSRSTIIDNAGDLIAMHNHPLEHSSICLFLLFDNPFVHSSIFGKLSVFHKYKYCNDPVKHPPEDYELWTRMVFSLRTGNLPHSLIRYRENSFGLSKLQNDKIIKNLILISSGLICSQFSFITDKQAKILSSLYHKRCQNINFFSFVYAIFLYILIFIYHLTKFKSISFETTKIFTFQITKLILNFSKTRK